MHACTLRVLLPIFPPGGADGHPWLLSVWGDLEGSTRALADSQLSMVPMLQPFPFPVALSTLFTCLYSQLRFAWPALHHPYCLVPQVILMGTTQGCLCVLTTVLAL